MANWEEFKGLQLIINNYEYNLAKSLLKNELGGLSNGYELSHAQTGNSGWSFGGHQMDLSKNSGGLALLKDIVINYYGDNYWTSSLENSLKVPNNINSISNNIKLDINQALSSDYGKAQINQNFVDSISKITNHIDNVEQQLQKINPNLQLSDGEKLMLADYHNQYNLSLNSQSNGSMLKKLQDTIIKNGDISIDDIRELFQTTEYYEKYPDIQGKRINNTYNEAKKLDEQSNNEPTILDDIEVNSNDNQSYNDAEYMEDQDGKDIPEIKDGTLVADSGQIKTDVNYDQDTQTLFYEDENGNIQQITYEENSDLLIYGNPNNPDKITFTDENGDYQVWEKDSEGNFVQTNKVDYSGTLNTAINQIGSLIIMNNQDFSNVEKIVVSTSVATIADFATYKGIEEFNTTKETVSNLQGAVVSFAISSFFAKNDNLSDILGMDGTFVGGLLDTSLSFVLSDITSHLAFETKSIVLTGDPFTAVGNLGAAYAGNYLGNKVMDWDTKSESMGSSIGSAIGAYIGTNILPIVGTFIGSFIGNIVGGIIGGLFGKKSPPPPTAKANYEFDEETESYNLISSSSSNGGNKQAMINIGKAFANHLENMFNLPGGQLIDSDFLPNIKVNQVKDTVTINGQSGSFDDVNQIMADLLVNHIPFINVENGDEYILRALNRTNESFQEGNPNIVKGRGDLEELYENISLAGDYSKYKNETVVLVDKNGNLITNTTQLQNINTLFQSIQNIQDTTQKEKALKEFLEEYSFVSQKDYVDKLLKENNPLKQSEINHWKEVFALAKELQLDTPHYSEDFNKLNSEISKYNYEQSELKGELVNIDYDKYLEDITSKILKIYNETELSPINREDNPKSISKDEAKAILEEIGYDFSYNNSPFEMDFTSNKEVFLTPERLSQLAQIAGLENPFENIQTIEDAFTLKGKSLNDLQFKLEDGKLTIKTFDKDLSSDEAQGLSQTFVINNWTKWDKTNTHIELPDGTKINLQALLETIGVKEGVGFVDVNEAFLEILSENETIEEYLKDYDSNNVYVGTSQDDTIKAYFEDNLIVTGTGNNTIVTGAGNDIVFAHNGANDINLGSGNDTVSYELNQGAIFASLESNLSSKEDTFEGVENLHGSKFNDILEGNAQNNTLFGSDGDDILIGLDGADVLDGGKGVDLASYETSSAVEINLKHNYAAGGEATGDSFINIEGVKGSKESDVIVGDDNANLIYANDGDDRVSANSGDDIVFAGTGNDYIKGDLGNDTLYGEDGDDILIGGAGDDILVGGSGKNTLLGDEGKDTVLYKGKSDDYEIMFVNENTLFVKSKDGKILDTLKDIEELAFDDVVFEIDYENKTLIKKVIFENAQEKENSDETLTNSSNNQSASIATAIMIGTVAAAQTQESSTNEMSYLSDDPASLDGLATSSKDLVIPILTKENPLFDVVQKIKEYDSQIIFNESTNTSNQDNEEKSYQIQTKEENIQNNDNKKEDKTDNSSFEIITTYEEIEEKEIKSEFTVTVENSIEEENLAPLIPAEITLDQIIINEDNNLYGIKISDLNNNETTLEVVFIGLPDKFLLSAGEKRADGNWYLKQNDLLDLHMIPQTNNSDDFDLTIKAIVFDTHGRVTISSLVQTITIIAVADSPNLEVLNTQGLEDTVIALNISTSLVDDLGGIDGEESIFISIKDVPSEAILSAGIKDEDGIWYLTPEELENLTITPKLHSGDDFTIKVTAYSIESENGHISSISKDIFVEVNAVADTPTLETSNSIGNEDTQIALNIKSSLIDIDGSEDLRIKIENIPIGAILNHGVKDNEGVWHLLPNELNNLTITPTLHDSTDFIIKVTAYSTEKENTDKSFITENILVEVNAVADKVNLSTLQNLNNRDDLIEATEDVSMMMLDISSTFIDTDGSETVHYVVEGLPEGTRLNQGLQLSDGSWKIEVGELQNLAILLKKDSDEDFRIKVSAITTESENNHQQYTSKFIDVTVQSVADFANLSVSNAKGLQNDFISLKIDTSLTDTDGSETLQIIIEDVPTGAILNNGVKGNDGKWYLTKEDLKDLSIRPEFNNISDFELKIKAVSKETKNGDTQESIAYIKVDVEPIPTSVNVTVQPTYVLEDTLCKLIINVDDSNLQPTESIYLELVFPKEFSLNQGQQLNNGNWKLRVDQLDNLILKTPPNYAGSILLDVVPVIVEANGTMRKNAVGIKLPVDIEAVADEASLEVSDIQANEDNLVYLNISSKLKDLDGSETLQLHILDVPSNAILNAGKKEGNIWIVEEKDIQTLAILAPENVSGTFNLQIQAISTDSNGDKKTISENMSITLNEIVDEPILNVVDSFVKNNESYISIHSVLQDTDGSEILSVEISGIPDTATLNAGIKTADGKYILNQNELNNLKISGLSNDEIILNIKAISSSGTQSKSVEKNITIALLEDEKNPFVYVNSLNISSQTNKGEILEYSGADDIIKSGGGSDTIYAQGGNDTIYADEASGSINVSFYLDATLYKTDGSEKLVFYIENIPEGFNSNIGYVNNGKLIIENINFDGNINISYPYTKENIQLKITASAISTDFLNPYINNSVLNLNVLATEKAGNDYINAGSKDDIVYGQDGDDILLGGDGNDILFGGNGNDYINGGNGVDRIDGGAGDDYIIMDAADFSANLFLSEIVNGGTGFDTVIIQDNIGVNFDMGLTNIENFIGGSGNDNIIGSQFADIVKGGKGADTYYTLAGNDIVYIDSEDIKAKSGNFIDTGTGYDKIYIEDSIGVDFDVADTNAEEIISGSGNDILRNSKNDNITIYGMDGDDIIYGSAGIDILDGGEGNDTINYSNSDFAVTINLQTNSASGGYAQNDIIENFENIVGTSKDDNLTGNNKDNVFYGGSGNNTINGLLGEDTVVFSGSLFDYYNGKDKNNIVTDFNGTATVYTSSGINQLTNINKLQFDDYVVYIDGRDNSPFVYNDEINGIEDTKIIINNSTLLNNDFDLEGNTLKIVGVKNATNGVVTLNSNGTISFNPNKNYNSSINNTFDKNSALYKGEAGFEYIVEDSAGNQRTAYVDVNISAVNDAPTIVNHYFNRNGQVSGAGRFIFADVDSNVDNISVKVISSVLGYTNIAGRTANANGEFYFDYMGEIYFSGRTQILEMNPFTVQISDDGDPLTGKNIGSIISQTGIYFEMGIGDPIVIDLDGDGIEIGEYYYEKHNSNLIGTYKDDAILVWDYNQDGTISSADETNWLGLSNTAKNDLDVLREIFDTNQDGIFNNEDTEWNNFALWQDKNMDGLVDSDEFTKISQSNILQLNLNIDDKSQEITFPIDEYASYISKAGEEHSIAAAYLSTTLTEEKLSQEDLLVLKEAIILNEQLASTNVNTDNFDEIEVNNSIFNDDLDEENIA